MPYPIIPVSKTSLIKEWDFERNNKIGLDPNKLACKSNKKAFWICLNNHSWSSVISSRTNGSGCPYCSNKKVLPGYNDLATTRPDIAAEWDYKKNTILPNQISAGSNKKAWFICPRNHSYETRVYLRALRDYTCPFCSNQKLLVGYNDLATTHPDIAAEWDYEKNDDSPEQYMAGSNLKKWFKCPKGHSYLTRIYVRKSGNGCPYCGNQKVLTGFNDLKTLFPKIATEWDYKKNKKRPEEEIAGSAHSAWFICPKNHSYKTMIQNRTRNGSGCPRCSSANQTSFFEQAILYYLHPKVKASSRKNIGGYEFDIFLDDYDIAIEYDGYKYHAGKRKNEIDNKKNDFANENSIILYRIKDHKEKIASYFDEETRTYHYRYQNGKYENFESILKELLCRLNQNHGIPVSSSSVDIKKDVNIIKNNYLIVTRSFSDRYPELAKEWSYEKNAPLTPEDVSFGSNLKVWWKCKKGHYYKMIISNKVKGRNCPICSNRIIVPGINDLATINPELVKEWNYKKNLLRPTEIGAGSNKKVWWRCERCGEEWKNSVINRSKGSGCPKCAIYKRSLARATKIVQIGLDGTVIREFNSMAEASRVTGINPGLISAVCLGKRKTTGGYIWKKA